MKNLGSRKVVYLIIAAIIICILGIVCVYTYNFSHAPVQDITNLSTQGRSEIGVVGFTPEQVEALQDEYESNEDSGIAISLLQQFVLQGKYTAAYDLLQQIVKKGKQNSISPQLAAYLYFNYYEQEHKAWTNEPLNEWGTVDQDTRKFYETLGLLAKGSYDEFQKSLEALQPKSPLYLGVITSLKQSKQTFDTLKQAPSYYYTGLLAVSLMQAGYLPLAQHLAEAILSVDKNYILSYEVLSQAALTQQDYPKALVYLQKLFTLDPQHSHRTSFYLGMAYYYLKDYNNALVYLNQVRDMEYIYDAVRYTILIHYQLKEYSEMMDGFRYLLTEQKYTMSDMTLFFDIVFYEPYAKAGGSGDFALAHDYAFQLVIPYIDACRKQYGAATPWVCKYGEAGWYLSQDKADKALKDLLYITKTYPHPTVYQALGDYYNANHDTAKAKVYYTKALVARSDSNFTSGSGILAPPIYSGNK